MMMRIGERVGGKYSAKLVIASFDALKEINYDGWLVIEAFSRNDPSFANAIHVWRDFAPSEEIWRGGLSFIKTSWVT